MHLLLDTHTFIWFLNGDNQLHPFIKKEIANSSNRCYLSIAGIWEIAIKFSLNKIELKGEFSEIEIFLSDTDITLVPIRFEHVQSLLQLPLHHRDPFDRIIISQGITENLTIATKDKNFKSYNVKTIWNKALH